MSSFSHVQEVIDDVYEKYKDIEEGELASYIPELAKANPQHFGIAMVTVDGQRFSAGDSQHEFTIQSICKPFAFQMALEEFGRDRTLQHVGVEPSGDAFNSIELEPKTMRPYNAMINAGAIAIASMIKKETRDAGVARSLRRWQGLPAGRCASTNRSTLRKTLPATAIVRLPISC